uniref:Helicase C-terminal domain-containing protein n=1 Tax=Glossina brevipalpis TaxID=37001 RepID=A0A1A9X0H6_9MUSC
MATLHTLSVFFMRCHHKTKSFLRLTSVDDRTAGLVVTEELHLYSDAVLRSDPDHLAALVIECCPKNNCLIFRSSHKNCKNVAVLLSRILSKSKFLDYRKRNKDDLIPVLVCTISYGVAYHQSGLTIEERKFIETEYCFGTLCLICCTLTLAAGVNLSAKRVTITAPYVGAEFMTLCKYKQMIGRAGCADLDEAGENILICSSRDNVRVREMLFSSMDKASSSLNYQDQSVHRFLIHNYTLSVLYEAYSALFTLTVREALTLLIGGTLLADEVTGFLSAGWTALMQLEANKFFNCTSLPLTSFFGSLHYNHALIYSWCPHLACLLPFAFCIFSLFSGSTLALSGCTLDLARAGVPIYLVCFYLRLAFSAFFSGSTLALSGCTLDLARGIVYEAPSSFSLYRLCYPWSDFLYYQNLHSLELLVGGTLLADEVTGFLSAGWTALLQLEANKFFTCTSLPLTSFFGSLHYNHALIYSWCSHLSCLLPLASCIFSLFSGSILALSGCTLDLARGIVCEAPSSLSLYVLCYPWSHFLYYQNLHSLELLVGGALLADEVTGFLLAGWTASLQLGKR